MLSLIILILSLIILTLLDEDKSFQILFWCGGLLIGTAMIFNSNDASIWKKEQDIVSLDYANSINGRFFLGSGSVEGIRHYYVYVQEGNLFKLISLNAEQTYLEETSEAPSIWKLKCDEEKQRVIWRIDLCGGEKTVLKIPKNSIIKEFKPN